MKKVFLTLSLIAFFLPSLAFLLVPNFALAQTAPATTDCVPAADGSTMCLNVPIGTLKQIELGTPGAAQNPLGDYIKTWYGFIVGTIGIFATVMIMWGGFQWLTSRGDSTQIGKAKTTIFAAIIGLVLVFMSYTILTLINPALTTISMPYLDKITPKTIPASNNTIVPFSENDPNYPGGNDKGTIENKMGCEDDIECKSGFCSAGVCTKKGDIGKGCVGVSSTRDGTVSGDRACASGYCNLATGVCDHKQVPVNPQNKQTLTDDGIVVHATDVSRLTPETITEMEALKQQMCGTDPSCMIVTSGWRSNPTSPHNTGEAYDLARNAQTNDYMNKLIQDSRSKFLFNYEGNQPCYGAYINGQRVRIINEFSEGHNCWHIDHKPWDS